MSTKAQPSCDPVPLTFDPDTVQRGTGGDPGTGGALAAQCTHGQGGGGPGNTRLNHRALTHSPLPIRVAKTGKNHLNEVVVERIFNEQPA